MWGKEWSKKKNKIKKLEIEFQFVHNTNNKMVGNYNNKTQNVDIILQVTRRTNVV